MKHFRNQGLWAIIGVWLIVSISACSKDDTVTPPNIENNVVAIVGETTTMGKPDDEVSVDLTFENPGSGAVLVIYRNDGPLRSVPLQNNQTTYTLTGETVPADVEEGDVVKYSFFLADEQNTIETEAVDYEVSIALYDEVQVGSVSVFSLDIPNGIVENGKIKLAKDRKYWLPASLHFMAGTELEMEAGAELYMNTETEEIYDVVIDEGARVTVSGTSTNPVVVTSDKILRDETPEPGDWGQFNIKGEGNGSASGSVAYMRLEYPGDRGFRLQGVGSGTSINYVQVYRALGEGIMPTDGDVGMKYLVALNCEGGGFRFGDAYAGSVQFAISQTTEFYDEVEAVAVRETASPVLSNFTVLGPGEDVDDTHGMRLRANSTGKVYNTVIADFPRRGLRLNDEVTVTDLQGPTVFAYSYVFKVPRDPYRDDTDNGNPFQGYIDDSGVFHNPFFNNVTGFEDNDDEEDPIVTEIAGIETLSYMPSETVSSEFNPATIGSFFASASFVGAIENAEDDWTKGWTRNYEGNIH